MQQCTQAASADRRAWASDAGVVVQRSTTNVAAAAAAVALVAVMYVADNGTRQHRTPQPLVL